MGCMALESQAEAAEVQSRSSAGATRSKQSTGLQRNTKKRRDIARTFFKVLHQGSRDLDHAPLRFKKELAHKVGVSDPLAAFGGVSPLQGGDYACDTIRLVSPS